MTKHYPLEPDERVRLYREFVNYYDTDHWLHKIRTWDILLDNSETFINDFGGERIQESGVESFEKTIKSEIVFTFYHISESLFMLMAAFGSHIPWIALKHLWVSDIEDFYEEELLEGNVRENLRDLFYPDMKITEETTEPIEQSVAFIEEYLERMGERFFDREIYNEYKHGLRLSTGEGSIRITPENPEQSSGSFERGGITHSYLDTERLDVDEDGKWYQIYHVMEGFDYELYLDMCYINHLLIEQMVDIRRQIMNSDEEGEQEASVTLFNDFDVEEIFDYNHEKEWTFRVTYSLGDEVTSMD